MRPSITLYRSAACVDAAGVLGVPGWLLAAPDAQGVRVLACGKPEEVERHPAVANATIIDLADRVLIPGLTNPHTHLDLTHVGPRPFDPSEDFRVWLDMVLTARRNDSHGIAASVLEGVHKSESGGVVAVGDIAGMGRREPFDALRQTPMRGVSFMEFFGLGMRQEATIAAMEVAVAAGGGGSGGVRLGVQPHAPYSAGLRVLAAAAKFARERGLPVSTHLAESMDERRFIADGDGPMRALVERLGIWDDTILDELGKGRRAVEHVAEVLARARFLVAHVNDCNDDEIQTLARTGTTVVYCARSSAYFGHHLRFGPHRYRDMLKAGVRVVLGTDSIINTPLEQSDRLTPLDDARLLHARDGVDPAVLLRMMTTDGGAALGLDPAMFAFPRGGEGVMAGVGAVDVAGVDPQMPPLERVMAATGGVALLRPGGASQ